MPRRDAGCGMQAALTPRRHPVQLRGAKSYHHSIFVKKSVIGINSSPNGVIASFFSYNAQRKTCTKEEKTPGGLHV